MKKLYLLAFALLSTVGVWAQEIDCNLLYSMKCISASAHNTTSYIGDDGATINGRQSSRLALIKFELAEEGKYYIKSVTSGNYINYTDANGVAKSTTEKTAWTLGAMGVNGKTYYHFQKGDTKRYLNNNGGSTSGEVQNLQLNNHINPEISQNNACSLWDLIEVINPNKEYAMKCDAADVTHGGANYIKDADDVISGANSVGSGFKFEQGDADGKLYIKSVISGKYISYNGNNVEIANTKESAKAWYVGVYDKNRLFFNNGNECLNNNGGTNKLQFAGHGAIPGSSNNCSLWHIEEGSTHEITDALWSSIYLDYNAAIPTGVKAYAVSANWAENKAVLTEITEGALAATNGYLLSAETAGKYFFAKSTGEASTVTTDLTGSVTDTYVGGDAYVLARVNTNVGLYKAKLNKDAYGNDAGESGTHFKNNANKAYLPAVSSEARVLTFDFDGNTETGINAVEIEEAAPANAAIYDLSGRRVQSAKSGLYIINGKKVIK